MKAKVLNVTEATVTLGLENGVAREVDREKLLFAVEKNDIVEIYQHQDGREEFILNNPDQTLLKLENALDAIQSNREKRRVSKVLYVIFALLLGGFGIHKFYAGKILWGIIYLFLCWTGIPAIVAFIEGIVALCKNSDRDGRIEV